jgi:hypothetical protein
MLDAETTGCGMVSQALQRAGFAGFDKSGQPCERKATAYG